MRAIAAALGLLALAACNREPSFDERYASAQALIQASAASIDADLAARASDAAAADAPPTAGPDAPPPATGAPRM